MTTTASGSIASESLAPATPPGTATDPSREQHHFSHKPALDGLRAVAVLSVFAYHLDYSWARGGFLGVDMFFVLSGYLITSLLLLEWRRSGTLRLGAFWARRARRLLPAVAVLLAVVAVWGRFALPANQWGGLRADSLWTLFYGANWHFIEAGQSYFTADPSPLRHTWSLAIEEQFYLVWPLVVFTCMWAARGKTWLVGALAGVGIVGSALVMDAYFTAGADPSRAYYGTDARAGQMLTGALLAVLLLMRNPTGRLARLLLQIASVVAAAYILVAFATIEDTGSGLYHGGFIVFAVSTAVVIAAMVQPTRNPLQPMLSLSPVRWIGAVSYGVYLWHWPIIVFVDEQRTGMSGLGLNAVRVALTFAIAALSYYLVEVPIRQRRFVQTWKPRLALVGGIAATVVVILASSVGATPADPLTAAGGSTLTGRTVPTVDVPRDPSIPTQRVLLLGDSVAYTLGDQLAVDAAEQGVSFRTVGRLGCGMTTGIALNDDGTRVEWAPGCASDAVGYQMRMVGDVQPDTVMWLSTWELSDHEVEGERLRFGTPAFERWLVGEIDGARQRFAERGARLALVTVPPLAENPLTDANPAHAAKAGRLNALLRRYADDHDGVALVDLAEIVCPGGAPCPTTIDGIVLRPKDGSHYEAEGAAWVSPQLLSALYDALRGEAPTTITTTPR